MNPAENNDSNTMNGFPKEFTELAPKIDNATAEISGYCAAVASRWV
jgi:hypothetical protein